MRLGNMKVSIRPILEKISVILILVSVTISYSNPRIKRAYSDNFNVLLNLYKMNPLKHSDVFKKFSNQILLPRPDGPSGDLNFNSNESAKEKQKRTTKSIERSTDTNDPLTKATENAKPEQTFFTDMDITDNAIINFLNHNTMNNTVTKLFPVMKHKTIKEHFHFFADEVKDFNKYNEIYDQDADTVIMK